MNFLSFDHQVLQIILQKRVRGLCKSLDEVDDIRHNALSFDTWTYL